MKESAFFTTGGTVGGSNVSKHELAALARVTNVKQVISRDNMFPECWRNSALGPATPFLVDYFSAFQFTPPVDLMFFNGAAFANTRDRCKEARAISDVPAHRLKDSIDEHVKMMGVYPYPEQTQTALKIIMRHHIKTSDIVLCPSKYSADCMVEDEEIPREKIVIIPHGCDLPKKTLPPPREFTVGTLGINGPDKGQIYLVNAIAKLHGMWLRERGISVSFNGMGTKLWKEPLSKAAPDIPFTASDWVSDLGSFYMGVSVYVQPSVTEGFGIPVLEAMSYGRPVIVTEGVGSKDLVQDGVNGFVVPIRDPEAIAKKILYLRANSGEVERMGKNARETAAKNQWGDIEKQYEELYRRVLEI